MNENHKGKLLRVTLDFLYVTSVVLSGPARPFVGSGSTILLGVNTHSNPILKFYNFNFTYNIFFIR